MEAAGGVLWRAVERHFANESPILILCGPGNNGGDGYVVGRLLFELGRKIDIFSPLGVDKLSGDAKTAYERLPSDISLIDDPDFFSYGLIIDALFGAGLSCDIQGNLAEIVSKVNQSPAAVLAVDLPSGVNGETGTVCGVAVEASATVTFFRFKPGHFLHPGREKCGLTEVGQIGIEESVLDKIAVHTFLNVPSLWHGYFPDPENVQTEHARGHTLVLSQKPGNSGPTRLMATAALRVGSDLVTIAGSRAVLPVHSSGADSLICIEADAPGELEKIIESQRANCTCLATGMQLDKTTPKLVEHVLETDCDTVLVGSTLLAFEERLDWLSGLIKGCEGDVVIVLHRGEFTRVFPEFHRLNSSVEMARAVARKIDAVVILIGPDTVIANAGGQSAIAANASPRLATVGSGDVLTGLVAGLIAQGMPAFYASCAAVWIHGEAADATGPRLLSNDLNEGIKSVVDALRCRKQ